MRKEGDDELAVVKKEERWRRRDSHLEFPYVRRRKEGLRRCWEDLESVRRKRRVSLEVRQSCEVESP